MENIFLYEVESENKLSDQQITELYLLEKYMNNFVKKIQEKTKRG